MLRRLPAPYGHVIVLVEYQGKSTREVASFLERYRETTERSAKNMLSKARRMLRLVRDGCDLKREHPGCYSKKNPWTCVHLPPLESLLLEGEPPGA